MDEGAVWWQSGVIYQIYPRSFQDGNRDGLGDLPGILKRVDYLSDTLGVDAVWLSPFYPSPMADFGYDVSNYTDVDPRFGTLADFDHLIAALHGKGIKLIVDFVPNHSSDQHPWFVESRASRDNPKRDWYIWRDAKPDGSRPNNWLAHFGGPAWEWDEQTGQYYLHSFLKEQPDLNWRNPEVHAAMLDAMRFWLERGVDGFRIDVAHAIMKDPELRDNPPNVDHQVPHHKDRGEYDSQLHLYDSAHPDVHDVFRDMRRLLDDYGGERPRMAIGEIHEYDWAVWASYYGAQLDELQMPFNFGLLKTRWDATAVRAVVDAIEGAVPEGAWPNYVLGNHDETRIASRVGAAEARVAMMLLLTLRGTPTMYYGDELGMENVPIPPEKEQDPWGMGVPGLGRDGERTPMQWDPGPNAGFCDADLEPWLPLEAVYGERNVEVELSEGGSMLALTRRLLDMRRSSRALSEGSYSPVSEAPATCFVYTREAAGERCLIALNFTDDAQTVPLTGYEGEIALSTHLDREGAEELEQLKLRPNEGLVVNLHRSP